MPLLKDLHDHKVRLVSLSLRDFRGFRILDLEFGKDEPINVLISDNGGGKTSILDVTAEFLRYFLNEGITKEETDFKTVLKYGDVTNKEAVAFCSIVLELTYQYPAKEIYEVARDIAAYLNDSKVNGKKANLSIGREESNNLDDWIVVIDDEKIKGLPKEIIIFLDALALPDEKENRKLSDKDSFKIAYFNKKKWMPSLKISAGNVTKVGYTKNLVIDFEINKSGNRYIQKGKSRATINDFISQFDSGAAFIEDFYESAKTYNNKTTNTVLPLLVYYGSDAINMKYDNIGVQYEPKFYQPYECALLPSRFNFKDFVEWFNLLQEESEHSQKLRLLRNKGNDDNIEEPEYTWNFVCDRILDILNADATDSSVGIYSALRVEQGKLWLDKKPAENEEALPIEISQLSAGEKNLFALAGDLVKRAVQLNPVLFKVDFDKEQRQYSDPLRYTHGIVLIDEIDLHLHPKWQRQVVPKLREIFPLVQFVVTTHSPFVLQSIIPKDASLFTINGFIITAIKDAYHYGRDISAISFSLQNVSSRQPAIAKEISKMYDLIDNGKIEEAKKQVEFLTGYLSEFDDNIIKAKTFIEFYSNDQH